MIKKDSTKSVENNKKGSKNERELWIDRPGWRVVSWFSVTFSVLIALVALLIASVANCQANKASQIALEVESRQLDEMQKRAFLALEFAVPEPIGKGTNFTMVYYDMSEIMNPRVFKFGVVNSGSKPSNGGYVILQLPPYLAVDSMIAYKWVDISAFEIWKGKGDTTYYYIPFSVIPSGDRGKGRVGVDLFLMTLKMVDPTQAVFNCNGITAKAWELKYHIVALDDYGLYQDRSLWVYFGIVNEMLLDSLTKENWESNIYDERFR